MVLISLFFLISVGTADRVIQRQRLVDIDEAPSLTFDDPDSLVKDVAYIELRQKRSHIIQRRNAHAQLHPSVLRSEYYDSTFLQSEYYRLKDNSTSSYIQRCCCPLDTTTGLQVEGLKCQYLYAFSDDMPVHVQEPLGLKLSSSLTKWGSWVCPGTTGKAKQGKYDGIGGWSEYGWHHPKDGSAGAEQCDSVKPMIDADQAKWQEAEDALNDDLSAVDGELQELLTSWGCQAVGGRKVSGSFCGRGGLTNVRNCKGKGRCYTTACYTCTKSPDKDNLFYKRKGEGTIFDPATSLTYVSTSGAVKAYALEQCRAACAHL